jgi:hypothetical protein
MRATRKTRTAWYAAMFLLAVASGTLAACGEEDFANRPRPPVPFELTGVVQEDKVTISPRRVGAGPVVITISNQTGAAHTITLEGESIRERVGPVQPLDTVTIQKSLQPGSYEVKAGSVRAVAREIVPAELTVRKSRGTSSNEVLQP